MIDAGKASGRLATKTNTALAMRVIIAVYFAELDHWLRAATQDVDAGMRALRSAFRLVIEGLRAH